MSKPSFRGWLRTGGFSSLQGARKGIERWLEKRTGSVVFVVRRCLLVGFAFARPMTGAIRDGMQVASLTAWILWGSQKDMYARSTPTVV